MFDYKEHLINKEATINQALSQLNGLLNSKILFVVNEKKELIGSLTDGDIRRGLLKNKSMSSSIDNIYQTEPKTLFLDELVKNLSFILEDFEFLE